MLLKICSLSRVEEARAAAGVAFADRLPAVGLRSQDGKRLMTEGEELTHRYASRTQEAYKAVGFLSFELDLWGKYRRLDEAARAELLSTEAARDTIRLAVASETALAYFQLRTLQEQERIAADMLKSYERTCTRRSPVPSAIRTRRSINDVDCERIMASSRHFACSSVTSLPIKRQATISRSS